MSEEQNAHCTAPAGASAPRVAVVGAGWAGLSAALALAEAGVGVSVFESAPMVGGRARTVSLATPLGRFDVDNGQHLIVGAYRDALALVDRLAGKSSPGARLERMPLALHSASGLRLQAAPLPAPLHLAWALAGARGLGPGGRGAMLRLMLALRAAGWRVPAGDTVATLLVRHRQPPQLVERIWAPLCIGALNTLPEQACAATFATVLRDTLGARRAASDFVLPDTPLGAVLPEPALQRLQALGAQVHLHAPVRALARTAAGRWEVAARGHHRAFDAVLLALPPWSAARLLAGSGLSIGRLGEFESEPIATGWAFWPTDAAPALPRWQLLDENASRGHRGQWLFDRGIVTNAGARARLGGIVVSVASRLSGRSADEIARGLVEQLASTIGGPRPTCIRIVTERRATFRCTPHRPRLQPDHLLSRAPGLWLAGDWLWPDYPATLEAAVRSGTTAADHLRRDLLRAGRPSGAPHATASRGMPNSARHPQAASSA
ncbi:MAG: hydroxysqualene dehydroxylase HpnE [Burkholderiaceae bacterium]|nr:hydroxysqualene dehydroxylase HpnE [Burkholderiaceae bacterium]